MICPSAAGMAAMTDTVASRRPPPGLCRSSPSGRVETMMGMMSLVTLMGVSTSLMTARTPKARWMFSSVTTVFTSPNRLSPAAESSRALLARRMAWAG